MRRLLAFTCAIVLIDTAFYAALVPRVPYFAEELGLSKSSVGVLSGAFGAGVLLGAVPSGYLAARLGVRPTALMGLSLMSATSLLFCSSGSRAMRGSSSRSVSWPGSEARFLGSQRPRGS